MKPQSPPSELALAFEPLKPVIYRAIGFSTLISLLALAPTVYMLEVYERVVNSRSGMTLAMLTVMIVLAYAIMELLEKVRGSLMRAAGVQVDQTLSKRVYDAMFQGFLKRQVGGSMQVLNDLKVVREFLANPALMAILEAPVALVALALIWAYLHHLIAGIRHLYMDVQHAVSKEFGRSSALATLGLSIALTGVLGAKLFGLY